MDGNIYRSGDNAGNGGSGIMSRSMSSGLGIMLTQALWAEGPVLVVYCSMFFVLFKVSNNSRHFYK